MRHVSITTVLQNISLFSTFSEKHLANTSLLGDYPQTYGIRIAGLGT